MIRTIGISRYILFAILLLFTNFSTAGTDLHWLWDDRCAECHGHSADFSRQFLQVSDGQLQGPHHTRNLKLFLRNHYAPAGEVEAIYDMLLAQVTTAPRFKVECSNCHDSASQFIRDSIIVQNGELISRESGEPVREFMQTHRRLKQDDIEFFMNLLARVAGEVNLK
ncbi:MAG: hypothetical protein ACERLB_04610 [Gammaproteobacteria bacterium]